MSLIIKLKNTTFGNLGLPTLVQTILGFPANGLQGLYLLEEGAVDVAHSGIFLDSSGKGNHASRRGDWPAPTRRSYGMEAASPDGCCIETPVVMTPSLTWVFAGRYTNPASSSAFPTFVGPSGGIGTSRTATNGNGVNFTINTDTAALDWGSYRAPAWAGDANLRYRVSGNNNDALEPSVAAVTFDNVAGTYLMKELGGMRDSRSGFAGEMAEHASSTSKVCFGVWRQGAGNASAEIYLAVCYNRALTEAELDLAMEAARARVAARGVTFTS